jgi:1-deoxy-D-xylulose-5-phosphate reductoisomerase
MKKQIAILGSTGSIGTQALQVIEEHPDRYEAYVLTANNRVEDLIAQARKFKPEAVVIANETKYQQLKDALADLPGNPHQRWVWDANSLTLRKQS